MEGQRASCVLETVKQLGAKLGFVQSVCVNKRLDYEEKHEYYYKINYILSVYCKNIILNQLQKKDHLFFTYSQAPS